MRQEQLNVLFEELERFTETVVSRLMALDGEALPKAVKAPKTVAAKKAAKVTNGTGRPRKELTKAEAAAYLKVSGNTVDAWCKRGFLPSPHAKEGHRGHFFYQADLQGFERPKRGGVA
jgi:DNA-binding transcriptional regulator YiaG